MDRADIAIIGGGAAGLAAAIFAAEAAAHRQSRVRVEVLETAARIGAKILISGGGRCNVTHAVVEPDDFSGARPVVRNVLAAFGAQDTVRWFASLGVPLKREATGKLFPVSDRAATVVEALLRRCHQLDVAIRLRHRVHQLSVIDDERRDRFVVEHAHGTLRARSVIMATGGRSLPRTGCDGSGWDIVRRLGHEVTDTFPALVPLVLARGMFHAELSGVSHPVELSIFAGGKLIDRRTGSLLWTHFGVSGPVVLDASRHWNAARRRGLQTVARCNVLPGQTFDSIERQLVEVAATRPRLSIGRWLAERLPARLAGSLARAAGIDSGFPISQLARQERRTLVHTITGLTLPIERDRGWDYAEVTAGGVPLKEIDYRTMESRKVPGLYLIGEMLDCDGRIGGFNFQWAWATGYLAGGAAAGKSSTSLST
ncbi:MAG TPA: NAD(P)/FAD-dependent oxidoreductase [Candidatus Binatia bacterium]|nr:NAD(P)/FAD-dependent oxidoreductase [Candidatus Binatia bacterium]